LNYLDQAAQGIEGLRNRLLHRGICQNPEREGPYAATAPSLGGLTTISALGSKFKSSKYKPYVSGLNSLPVLNSGEIHHF
jgi:hypothetical protein